MPIRTMDWRAATWAGIISGAVFMMLEMLVVPLFLGDSPWAPPRMIGAIVLGEDVLPMPGGPPPTFDLAVMMVAVAVHFALSIVYAIILAWLIAGRSLALASAIGAVFGLALYLINFHGFTALFPWFAMARNWVSVFAHIVFGVVAGIAYHGLEARISTRHGGIPHAGDDRVAAD